MMIADDSAESARHLFDYDQSTGLFRRKVRTGAGCKMEWWPGYLRKEGYCQIRFAGRNIAAHRLAFLIMTGNWPENEVDHINGDRADNRWSNLRLATRQQNMINIPPRGSVPFKGVYKKSKNTFGAEIRYDGVRHWLGSFPTAEMASAAYELAAQKLCGEYRWKP